MRTTLELTSMMGRLELLNVDRRWLAFSKNGPDSPCTVFQITVRYGSTWRGCRRRGTQKFKMDVEWLPIVLRCCSDVVELDLSFKTRIRLPSNSSGWPSCGPDTVLNNFLLFFDQFSVFFGRRGRPLGPDTQTGKRKTCDFIIQIFS